MPTEAERVTTAVARGRELLAAGSSLTELLCAFRDDEHLGPLPSIMALRELAPVSLDMAKILVSEACAGRRFDHLGATELRQIADILPGPLALPLFYAIVRREPFLLLAPSGSSPDGVRMHASSAPEPMPEHSGWWAGAPFSAVAEEFRREARQDWWSTQIDVVRDEPDALLLRFPRVGDPRFEPPTIREVPPDDRVYLALTQQYFAELRGRFGAFEEPAPGSILADVRAGCALVVSDHGGPLGCATLRLLDATTAEVKRMFVLPRARGLRLGEAMLVALENAARARGCSRVVLDTHASLVEAARLYRRVGYREIARYNDNPYAAMWFERPL